MSILFASNYAGALILDSGSFVEITSSNSFDSTYVDAAIQSQSATLKLRTPTFAAELTEGWAHHSFACATTNNTTRDGNFIELYNVASGRVDATIVLADMIGQINYWNGSALTAVGSTADLAFGTTTTYAQHVYDLYFKKHASAGIIRLYRDGSLLLESTGLDTSNFNVTAVRFCSFSGGAITQMLVADESTIGMKVFTPNLSAGNSNTMAAGTASDVDINAVPNFNTYITGDTNAQKATFALEDIPGGSLIAKAVAVNMRAKKGASGPSKANMVARVGGTDYNHATDHALTVGIDPFAVVYNTNPATGLAWDNTTVDASEFGVRVTT